MKTLLELAYDKHKDWINIVKSFGCNPSNAEDIVQEMYLQLHFDIMKGLDLEDLNSEVLDGIEEALEAIEDVDVQIKLEVKKENKEED